MNETGCPLHPLGGEGEEGGRGHGRSPSRRSRPPTLSLSRGERGPREHRRDLPKQFLRRLALLLLAAAGAAQAQPVLTPIVSNGPTDRRINLVIVAEGFVAGQEATFVSRATAVADDLLSTPPYDRYRPAFNVFGAFVPSAQTGSDHPSRGVFRDTYFDSYYDCGGIERLICVGAQDRVQTLLVQTVPDYDIVFVLVNDPEYGGSGGVFAVGSVHPLASDLALHEIGHSFGRLADEYGGTEAGFTSLNTTVSPNRELAPWSEWIEASTPTPTPDVGAQTGAVGLFLGAAYSDTGAYRPQRFCEMRELGRPFCAVCHEHHVGAIYGRVSPLDAVSPAGPEAEGDGGPLTFRVETLVPPADLAVEWTVDGVPVEADGPALTLTAYADGSTVAARVLDTSTTVREPSVRALMEDTYAWTVRGTATGAEGDPERVTRLGVPRPNPVRASTRLSFWLAAPARARLSVVDVLGREVAVVADGPRAAGAHGVDWAPGALPAGVYLVRLDAAGVVATRALTLLR
ncbi:M64 family metallopeptidase [Rubrivirga sp.]|uniref:M64 family metallopeptidase n=1 Tax=Rubrivirga sp. TaxID=1885344 RepID=UPI003B52AABE